MNMPIQPPDQGLIFWPVGNGDSTTIRVDKTAYLEPVKFRKLSAVIPISASFKFNS